jgi:lipoprotein-anchoring transpeptidase ErfK/SrfK
MINLRRAGVLCLVAILACVGFQTATASALDAVVPARIDVSIKLQRAFVYGSDGSLMREIPISSGADGRTPLGHFRVSAKSAWTTATSNPRVHMLWMTNFDGGIGFHGIPRSGNVPLATPLGVRPVSHGCVRMADVDAHWIYQWVPMGTPVNVIPK